KSFAERPLQRERQRESLRKEFVSGSFASSPGKFWGFTSARRPEGGTPSRRKICAVVWRNSSRGHNPRKHTRRNPGPWPLVHSEEYPTRSETVRGERFLKSGVDCLIGRASPPEAD